MSPKAKPLATPFAGEMGDRILTVAGVNFQGSRELAGAINAAHESAVSTLRGQLAAAREAIRKFGEHRVNCRLAEINGRCTCGLHDALYADEYEPYVPKAQLDSALAVLHDIAEENGLAERMGNVAVAAVFDHARDHTCKRRGLVRMQIGDRVFDAESFSYQPLEPQALSRLAFANRERLAVAFSVPRWESQGEPVQFRRANAIQQLLRAAAEYIEEERLPAPAGEERYALTLLVAREERPQAGRHQPRRCLSCSAPADEPHRPRCYLADHD